MAWRANPNRDKETKLRGLCGEKGYTAERALMKNRWRLTEETTGIAAVNEHGSTAFTIPVAMKYLQRLKVPRARQ